ncbi:hypothetical protein HanRHA438_Chr12g0557291 [Helianthus annuus]|nr:hypothetical protein HanHA300_Chr12g0447331 [Helianthus annuus]KAJ0505646.1 hypothetical protein HanHA89_Chr12g0472851 [Helianthus annuus]KAJ0675313.1 hypothetical protein HanLR1_Chr12g0449771 [Helianthus annuus]KAJ0678608.1 hypothetical protein HanOQP8_Chr12g0449831 [Helianthus annuus]KAJ0866925.1 hypothetical protein HanRHA438_Chr12g0557291 [Helianthus annuus]
MSEPVKDANQNQYPYEQQQQQQVPPPPPLPPPHQYGTFQGVQNYPPHPVTGFPQPSPPGGPPVNPYVYAHQHQPVPGTNTLCICRVITNIMHTHLVSDMFVILLKI